MQRMQLGDPRVKVLEKRVNCYVGTTLPTSDAVSYDQVQLPSQPFLSHTFWMELLGSLSFDLLEHTSNFIQNPSYLFSICKIPFYGNVSIQVLVTW